MSSPHLQIGLVQLDIIWESPDENMRRIEKLLDHHQKSDLILLPEMWSTGFTMHPESAAEIAPGPSFKWMIELSKRLDTSIAGSLAVKEGPHYFNRLFCTFPDGRFVHYDKKHLFSYAKENNHYSPGSSKIMVEIKGWKIMPFICYDLRFPVWCRNTDDYDLMIVVANWPKVRIHHWDSLLKARAIENQCFVAAVNRTGRDENGLVYNGNSIIYDMNGSMLLQMDDQEGFGTLSLEKEALLAYRDQFRFLNDRDRFLL